jgi:serine/threonine protein kinase
MRTPDSEPFELLDQLGRGGFATTWKARVIDPELRAEMGEIVAVKVPHGRKEARMLKGELELNAGLHMRLRRFSSPHLVRYLGFELFQGGIVMVMEYVPEGSLRGRMHGVRMPAGEATEITAGILRGLSLIHREEIVHRDIKPENILMSGNTAKIADFGISRVLEAGKVAFTQAGTYPYMPPEMLSDQGTSSASDIWSTGVTLYEMVTGRRPFGDATTSIRQLIEMICTADPIPAQSVCPGLPPRLTAAIERSLHKDPRQRFKSADEMCNALDGGDLPTVISLSRELEQLRATMEDPGKFEAIDARLRKLMTIHPGDVRVHQALADLMVRRDRLSEAVALLTSASGLAPGDGGLQWRLALTLQRMGDKPRAIEAIRRGLQLGLADNVRGHAERLLKSLGGAP